MRPLAEAGRLMGLREINHDAWTRQTVGIDVARNLARELKSSITWTWLHNPNHSWKTGNAPFLGKKPRIILFSSCISNLSRANSASRPLTSCYILASKLFASLNVSFHLPRATIYPWEMRPNCVVSRRQWLKASLIFIHDLSRRDLQGLY